jgi:hypothetical protein
MPPSPKEESSAPVFPVPHYREVPAGVGQDRLPGDDDPAVALDGHPPPFLEVAGVVGDDPAAVAELRVQLTGRRRSRRREHGHGRQTRAYP